MNKYYFKKPIIYFLAIIPAFFYSCKSGPFNVFKAATPHEAYKAKLISSGLNQNAIAVRWINLSDKILLDPVTIEIPYFEKGYFSAEKVQAAAFSFKMQRGQKLKVSLTKKPITNFKIFTDVWEEKEDGELLILGSSDTLGTSFESVIDRTGTFILRLQPELLAGGEYSLEITSGPSLDYPLKSYQQNQVRSFWGDGRDGDSRKHEGVDIFSGFRTPVLAIAPGITRVNENNLGGKVVWLRPEGKDFTIYYAHLDEQVVTDGQKVSVGDTLGRMGNTGNARTTPPHLHFGIYTGQGAVDPWPFINPLIQNTSSIKTKAVLVNSLVRTNGNATLKGTSTLIALKNGTIAQINSASGSNFRIELPDGTQGFIASTKTRDATSTLSKLKLSPLQTNLFDKPDSSAAVKLKLKSGDIVDLIGSFEEFDLVSFGGETGWINR